MVRPLSLTPVDIALMEKVGDFWATHRYAPSYRDLIGAFTTLNSQSAVKYHLDTLVKIKLLRRIGSKLRSLSLTPAAFPYLHSTPIVTRLTLPLPEHRTLWENRVSHGLQLSAFGRAYVGEVAYAAQQQVKHLPEPLRGAVVCTARLYCADPPPTTLDVALLGLQRVAITCASDVRELHLYHAAGDTNPRIEMELWKVWQ